MSIAEAREAVKQVADKWWLFQVGGLAWRLVSLLVLSMNLTSAATVGILLGLVILRSVPCSAVCPTSFWPSSCASATDHPLGPGLRSRTPL